MAAFKHHKPMTHPLLIPRYICTAPDGCKEHYPNSPFEVGEILTLSHADKYPHCHDSGCDYLDADYFNQYPHLFAPLPWYAHRELSEMPEYVKGPQGILPCTWNLSDTGKMYANFPKVTIGLNMEFYCEIILPATLSEYEAYLKTKK